MRRNAWEALLVALCLCAAATWGCGDDSSVTDDGGGGDADADGDADGDGDADADADADGDDGGGTGTLSVLVLGSPLLQGTEWPPLEGAAVAFDLPGGGRVEGTTDATGHVSFDGFDWSAGTGAVTAWAETWGLASLVGLDGSEGEVTLVLPNVGDPTEGWVDLTVTVTNMVDVSHRLEVGTQEDGVLTQSTGMSPTFTVPVPASRPFTLGGIEFTYTPGTRSFDLELFSVKFQEHAAVTAPAPMELDLSGGTTLTPLTGSFAVPTRAESPLRTAFPYAVLFWQIVKSRGPFYNNPMAGFGCPTHMEWSTDGNTVSYELGYSLPPAAPTAPMTRYMLLPNDDVGRLHGSTSFVDLEGIPDAGAQTFAFLDLPDVEPPTTAYPLYEPITWTLFDTDVTPTLYLRITRTAIADTNLWWITAPTDATTLTVPPPPTAVPSDVIGTGRLRAVVGIRANDPGTGIQDRYAESALFQVQP